MRTASPSGSRRDTLILAVAVVLLAVGALLGRPKRASPTGATVPDVSLRLIANGTGDFHLATGDEGDAALTVLEFFASWCSNCERHLPGLETAAERRGVRWLSVSVDESRASAKSAARRWGLSEPVALDDERRLTRFFGVSVLPTTVVVGRDGRVRDVLPGSISEAQLLAALDRAHAD